MPKNSPHHGLKIACWSGPRNLSTAMMYCFGEVMPTVDEPFYAAFLAATGLNHPMREEILATQPTDPQEVVARFPKGAHYLKLMTHHMLPGMPLDWAADYKHVFLIRHPARVLTSYLSKREVASLQDLGLVRQAELFAEFGGVVIDSADIRNDPAGTLGRLCAALGLGFDPKMLSWPEGGKASDGIWAAHWYGAVHRSTGFAGPEAALPQITSPTLDAALPLYEELAARRI